MGVDSQGLSRMLGVHMRTLSDWKREKFSMPLGAVRYICRESDASFPSNAKIQDQYWYIHEAARKGGEAVIKKYGRVPVDKEFRDRKWREWWNKNGASNLPAAFKKLPLFKPKYSKELAEFFGIMMGDGGMSKRQISITLHHTDDLAYSKFVMRLIKKLFRISPSIRHIPKSSANSIVVSRTNLVSYLHLKGLPIGNKIKQGLDIPGWIKRNHKYFIPCIRGLVDTDGCIFINKYKVNGRWYAYKKLCLTSGSKPLRDTACAMLQKLGFKPQVTQEYDIRLNSQADVVRYFRLIGSHNPKHLKKYMTVI